MFDVWGESDNRIKDHLKTSNISFVLLQKALEASVGVNKVADCGDLQMSEIITKGLGCRFRLSWQKGCTSSAHQSVYVPY